MLATIFARLARSCSKPHATASESASRRLSGSSLLPALFAGGACLIAGCQEMSLMPAMSMRNLAFETKAAEDAKFDAEFVSESNEFEPPYVADYVTVSGLNLVTLEGVGLVTGLDGTGGDPPPSQFRTQLLDDMRRRDIPDPNRIISSPSTALVVVRAYLPPLVQPGDNFDVEVRVPDGSTTTSLNGGWLLECRLTERAIVPGRGILEGKERARAKGPILVSTGEGSSNSLLRRGRIVGGGVGMESRDMRLLLKNDLRSVRNSTRIAERIGTRFFSYDRYGHREPLAEAVTDQKVVLNIHPSYKDNFPRYVQVIQNIAFRETEVERQVRMERLTKELKMPEKSELAALQLEAIGLDALPMLRQGLDADTLECRFHAAVALAYLQQPDGLEVLYEAARDEPAFRVFALAAMSCVDEGETHMYLRQLMDNTQMETRYGAFRCMTTIDDRDPFVRGEVLNDQCKLHVLDVLGEPMLHLTHRQKAEIVLFGADQRFKTPMALSAGPHIMVNASSGGDKVIVSRYRLGDSDQRREVTPRISEVLRACAELGASYPDLAQLLMQAERQQNLPGQIGIDMLPEAGRYYERPEADSRGRAKKRIGRETLAPNQFAKGSEDEEEATKPLLAPEVMEAEEVDETEAADEAKADEKESVEKDEEKKSFDPIRSFKRMVIPKTHGELVYPDTSEEEE
uniref:Flagellar P-ring protein n=2 Tax=Rubinisphaera brasiliensis TaxID=119 RepID=F0SK28_RUBBR|nr:flagellar P-ring protein [Rubinisphaera brasiliensis DSM 5305]